MSFLAETFSTKLAREGFLPGVSPHVDIDTVLVFESLVADVAVVQQPRLLLGLLLGPPVVLPGHLGEVRQLGGGGGGGAGRVPRLVQHQVTRHVHLDGDDAAAGRAGQLRGGGGALDCVGGGGGGGGGAARHACVREQLIVDARVAVLEPRHGLAALQLQQQDVLGGLALALSLQHNSQGS